MGTNRALHIRMRPAASSIVLLAVLILLLVAAAALAFGGSQAVRGLAGNPARVAVDVVKAVADSQRVRSYSQGQMTNIIFLHHSVGSNLIEQGELREQLGQAGFHLWDQGYNGEGLHGPDGSDVGYSYYIPGDNTDPDGLAGVFQQPVYVLPLNAFSGLLQHEVIILKSCFTASQIESDDELAQVKSYYAGMRELMAQHPDRVFILMTPPPLNPAGTDAGMAARSRALAGWMSSGEFLAGRDNLHVFDLFGYLAEDDPSSPEFGMLRAAFRNGSDSHPNRRANSQLGPLLAQFIAEKVGHS